MVEHSCMCFLKFLLIFIDKISVMVRKSAKLLVSTIKHMRQINQLLLIPLTLWSGLEQTFLFTQFTKVSNPIFSC
jgi:hypothetical protein